MLLAHLLARKVKTLITRYPNVWHIIFSDIVFPIFTESTCAPFKSIDDKTHRLLDLDIPAKFVLKTYIQKPNFLRFLIFSAFPVN